MRLRNKKQREPTITKLTYGSVLSIITLCVVVTVLASSVSLYFSFRPVLLSSIFESEKERLFQLSRVLDLMTDNATEIALRVLTSSSGQEALNGATFTDADIKGIRHELDLTENSTPFLESLYVYNDPTATFFVGSLHYTMYDRYTQDSFFDQDALRLVENLRGYRRDVPIAREIQLPLHAGSQSQTPQRSNVLTFIFNESLWSRSALILNVPREWLERSLQESSSSGAGYTFVLNRECSVIAASDYPESLAGQENLEEPIRPILQQVLGDAQRTEYFTAPFAGQDSLIVYSAIERLNWYALRVIPLQKLMQPTRTLMLRAALVAGLILIGGFLGAWMASRKVYAPIDTLYDQLDKLEEERSNDHIVLAEDLLRNVLRRSNFGNFYMSTFPVSEKEIPVDLERPIHLVLLTIDGYSRFCRDQLFEKRRTIKYAVIRLFIDQIGSGSKAGRTARCANVVVT
jgi:two-component system, response regulator YesN